MLLDEIGSWDAMRDRIVREVSAAGVSQSEIARKTGIARSTITRILTRRESPR